MQERLGLCSLLVNAAPRFLPNDINSVIRGAAKTKNTQFLYFFLSALVCSSFPSDYAHSPSSYDTLLRPDTWAVPEAAAALQFLVLAPADEDAAAAAMRAGALVFLRSASSPDTAPALAPAVHAAIAAALPLLRRLKHRQEDVHPRRRSESPRRDVEDVYALVATLVRHAPDAALSFWDDRAFLDWAVAVRTPSMLQGLLEMLTSLASCAPDNAHRLLLASHGRASYSAFFSAFQAVAQSPTAVPPEEWAILVPFCALVRTILSNSPPARALLYLDASFRAVPTLVSMLALPIDLATKGAILKTLSAFAITSSEPHLSALDRRRDIWFHLEASAVIDPNPNPSSPTGILAELKIIEEPAKQYPVSTAFVELLAALAQPLSISASSAPSTIHSPIFPLNLGVPHRSPGLDPYVSFVIDQVFLQAPNRPYANAPDKWIVLDQTLSFMQASLASLSFSSFLLPQQSSQSQPQSQPQTSDLSTPTDHVLAHPGFDIFLRILSASPLLDALCHIASSLLDDLENDTPNTPAFKSAVKHTLHIFKIILDLHPVFAQLVQPLLLQTPNLPLPTQKLNMLRSADALDALLLSQPQVVVRIATLINCTTDPLIPLYSVQILSHLSQSPHWSSEWQFRDFYNTKMNRLVGVVDTSDETLRIVDGYAQRLEPRSSEYYSPPLDEEAENQENNGESLLSITSSHHTIDDEIKSSVLDLLIQNTLPNVPAPNIAHLLLGYDLHHSSSRGQLELKSLASPGSGRAAIHVVLLLIDPQSHGHHFRSRHPDLAQKCYNLVQQLCHHSQTSASTSRYLRSQENYFYLQSLGLPFAIPSAQFGSRGIVRHTNGKQVHTSCAALTSTLHAEASLLESVALELNNLVIQNNRQHAKAITSAFLQNFSLHNANNTILDEASITPDFLDVNNITNGNYGGGNLPSSSPDQSECRILNTFYSLDFVWQDDISLHQLNSPILAGLPYNTALRKDTNGCQIYDLKAVLLLINTAQQDFQRKGLLTNTQEEQIKSESKVVLLWFAAENNRLQVEHARVHMLKAWRMLLDICLVHDAAFEYAIVDPSNRKSLLLNLLYTVLLPLSASDTTPAQAEILSGASLVIIARLRSESSSSSSSLGGMGTSDAVDKLHNLLKLTLRSISQPGISPVVRGNLYSLLLNYFAFTNQLASSSTMTTGNKAIGMEDDVLSLDGGSTANFSITNRSIMSKNHHNTPSSLQDGISNTLNSYLERTLLTICSDAAGGPEVWQAVAFATLDVLSSLKDSSSSSASSLVFSKSSLSMSSKVVSILAKHGELQNIVLSLKETESQLMDVLSPEPSSLNALYTYEAKMSFLIQLSRNRQSALKLVDAKIIYVLAQCEYLNSPGSFDQYNMDQDNTDFDTFLPSLIEIQHQLVIPALQLVVNLVAATASETPACISQAIQFISSKHVGMVECLRTTATTTAAPTISGIQESKLIVTLLRLVMSSPHLHNINLHGSSGDFLSPNSGSFGSLHAAIRLFLVDFFPHHHHSQRYQNEDTSSSSLPPTSSWLERINPSNESEINDARIEIISPSLGLTTIFDEECSDLLDGLCSALLSYLVTATRQPSATTTTKSFYPVFEPTFAQNAAPPRGKTPTLFHLASFAENVATLLGTRMELLLEIIYRSENADEIAIAELDEYVLPADMDKSESERRVAAKVTLTRILPLARNKAVLTLHLVEMSLLLFWRHLCHYLGTQDRVSTDSSSTTTLLFGGGTGTYHLGSESSKSHIRNNAKLYMERISNLLSPSWMLNESFGLEVRSHQALVDSLRRNCNDILNSNMNE